MPNKRGLARSSQLGVNLWIYVVLIAGIFILWWHFGPSRSGALISLLFGLVAAVSINYMTNKYDLPDALDQGYFLFGSLAVAMLGMVLPLALFGAPDPLPLPPRRSHRDAVSAREALRGRSIVAGADRSIGCSEAAQWFGEQERLLAIEIQYVRNEVGRIVQPWRYGKPSDKPSVPLDPFSTELSSGAAALERVGVEGFEDLLVERLDLHAHLDLPDFGLDLDFHVPFASMALDAAKRWKVYRTGEMDKMATLGKIASGTSAAVGGALAGTAVLTILFGSLGPVALLIGKFGGGAAGKAVHNAFYRKKIEEIERVYGAAAASTCARIRGIEATHESRTKRSAERYMMQLENVLGSAPKSASWPAVRAVSDAFASAIRAHLHEIDRVRRMLPRYARSAQTRTRWVREASGDLEAASDLMANRAVCSLHSLVVLDNKINGAGWGCADADWAAMTRLLEQGQRDWAVAAENWHRWVGSQISRLHAAHESEMTGEFAAASNAIAELWAELQIERCRSDNRIRQIRGLKAAP